MISRLWPEINEQVLEEMDKLNNDIVMFFFHLFLNLNMTYHFIIIYHVNLTTYSPYHIFHV